MDFYFWALDQTELLPSLECNEIALLQKIVSASDVSMIQRGMPLLEKSTESGTLKLEHLKEN